MEQTPPETQEEHASLPESQIDPALPEPRAETEPALIPDPVTDIGQRHREAGVTDLLPFGRPGLPMGQAHPFLFGFTGALGVIMAWLLVQALLSAQQVLIMIIVALFLAVGLSPAVEFLRRTGLSRGKAVGLVFLGVVLFFVLVGWALVPPIVNEVSHFAENVPNYITQLQGNEQIRDWDQKYQLLEKAKDQLTQSGFQQNVASWALDIGKGTLSAIFNTLTILILTLYFLSSLPQIKMFFYRLTPRSRRARVALLGDEVLDRIGGYVAGNFIISLIAGITTYIFLEIAGVPYALALSLIVAVTDLIPLIGATIGAVVVSIVAFLTGMPEGIAAVIFFVIYQQVENYLIAPRVMKRSVDVQPAVTVIAALIGAKLLGVVGALLAIPVAAAISLIVREVINPRQETR
ncbi:MAG: AI-2E family transporter [Streptosporangiaceae bacterium]